MTPRWAGSNPLWPELATGITDLRMATGEIACEGPHKDWYEKHDPVLRLARELAASAADARGNIHKIDDAIERTLAAATRFALESPLPAPASALRHVFVEAS